MDVLVKCGYHSGDNGADGDDKSFSGLRQEPVRKVHPQCESLATYQPSFRLFIQVHLLLQPKEPAFR